MHWFKAPRFTAVQVLACLLQGLGIPLPVPKATLREEAARAKAEAEKQAAILKVRAS